MDKREKLEHITNGFRAAHRIRNTYDSTKVLESDTRALVKPSKREILNDIVQIIAEYAPGTYKKVLNDTVQKSTLFSDTYKNIRQHLSESRGSNTQMDNFVSTLNLMRPALNNKDRAVVDKIMKLYEIFR